MHQKKPNARAVQRLAAIFGELAAIGTSIDQKKKQAQRIMRRMPKAKVRAIAAKVRSAQNGGKLILVK